MVIPLNNQIGNKTNDCIFTLYVATALFSRIKSNVFKFFGLLQHRNLYYKWIYQNFHGVLVYTSKKIFEVDWGLLLFDRRYEGAYRKIRYYIHTYSLPTLWLIHFV